MTGRLAGKVAIITGGAGGIGAATGEVFCKEGARVALIDEDSEALERAVQSIRSRVPNAGVAGYAADLSIEDNAALVVERVTEELGAVSVLVNNVAARAYDSIADGAWSKWDRILRVNLLSFVSMTRASLRHLRACGHGCVINVSSTYALHGRSGMAAYDATKAAILSLTSTLANEEAEHKVRVNAVCPGYTLTPFHVQRLGTDAAGELQAPCLLGRWADPVEIAFPMLWLASEEASYVTGATFVVDGGLKA